MRHIFWGLAMLMMTMTVAQAATTTSFAEFDRRAKMGERLTVVFFGASLTWGANATDPITTSYRAVVANYMETAYPKAHFKFYDAAIGGTGSQLGVFRLDHDVLSRKPDLVFLDFSANDDIYSDAPESLASYESLVRRLILDGQVPVVQVIFPFGWNVKPEELPKMKRRDAHMAIAKAYNTVVGDAIQLCTERIQQKKTTVAEIWSTDQVHPGDFGYRLFGEAAWNAYRDGVKRKVVCSAPDTMLYAETYMRQARVRISTLGPLPQGWRVGKPNLVAAWYDGLMSRWLDDEVIASNRAKVIGEDGKAKTVAQAVEPLKVRFSGSMVLLFGEETMKSCQYHVYIDGKLATRTQGRETVSVFDASAKRMGGNRQHAQLIATGLDPNVEHTLVIEPLLLPEEEQELRLESICVAGGQAWVKAN